MSELEMKTEAEVEDFTDELSDEALDRAEGVMMMSCGGPNTSCLTRRSSASPTEAEVEDFTTSCG